MKNAPNPPQYSIEDLGDSKSPQLGEQPSVVKSLPQAPSKRIEIKEKLAAVEHERWASWQNYLHSFLTWGGTDWHLPNDKKEQWQRQIETPYSQLSDEEKASDMREVDRYWPLIEAYTTNKIRDAKIDVIEQLVEPGGYLDNTVRKLEALSDELGYDMYKRDRVALNHRKEQ